MPNSRTKTFSILKDTKSSETENASRGISSEASIKSSSPSRMGDPWLIIVISFIAIGGILATVGIAVTKFAILRSTPSTSKFNIY